MHIQYVTEIAGGQDGAIWDDYLFRFDPDGICCVYHMDRLSGRAPERFASFPLEKTDIIKPHSNAVMFGREYYAAEDEFPLLYTNVYNNHAKEKDAFKGVCCVYRIQRDSTAFSSTLVQIIQIGFVEDARYWSSSEDGDDVRPYGNFTIDRQAGIYYAFTMRDKYNSTRYFSFPLPKLTDGVYDERFGVNTVTLSVSDMTGYFDCEYHRFIQGACTHNGKIYSLEGFTNDVKNPPALRVICPENNRQEIYIPFSDFGLAVEPEFIDFKDDVCYYADLSGKLYTIDF